MRSVPKAAATCSGLCPYLSPTRGSTPRAISSSAMAGSHDPSAARNRSVLPADMSQVGARTQGERAEDPTRSFL